MIIFYWLLHARCWTQNNNSKKDRTLTLTELIFLGKHAHMHVYVVVIEKRDNQNLYWVINNTV